MIDTHSHIYSEEFDDDRAKVIQRAKEAGVTHIILPNIDSESLPRMLALAAKYPDFCAACIGLHPTSVTSDFKNEFTWLEEELTKRKFIAIGEIGIDLYWDKTFLKEQIEAFQKQLTLAIKYNIPAIIHVRDSFKETMEAMQPFKGTSLKGVFHSFTGNEENAKEIIEFGGFYLGINGIVTFKNSGLANTLEKTDLHHIVLETDAPYLAPMPHRGKRNESAYVQYVCEKLAAIYNLSSEKVENITTNNARELFRIAEN